MNFGDSPESYYPRRIKELESQLAEYKKSHQEELQRVVHLGQQLAKAEEARQERHKWIVGQGALIAEMKTQLSESSAENARLRAALRKAQEGLDLAHSCGLPPSDTSGRQMWNDSAEIRMQTRNALSSTPSPALEAIREATEALETHLMAGHKEARRGASAVAKSALARLREVFGEGR